MPRLPTRSTAVVLCFAPLFRERSWQHAEVLLVGAILAPGRCTVTSILRSSRTPASSASAAVVYRAEAGLGRRAGGTRGLAQCVVAPSCCRSVGLWTLPTALRGSASAKTTDRGTL
jgi:hypothetical protein